MRSIDKKIVLIGKPGTGKTSLLFRLTDKKFLPDDKRKSTVGADVSSFPYQQFYVRIWDTAGDQNYDKETYIYCYNADLMVFFIDLTCIHESIQYFQNIEERIPDDAQYLVVFTKKDLIEPTKMYSKQQLQEYAKQAFKNAGVFGINNHSITSAKMDIGIQELLPYWINLLTPIIVPTLVLSPPTEEEPEPLMTNFTF